MEEADLSRTSKDDQSASTILAPGGSIGTCGSLPEVVKTIINQLFFLAETCFWWGPLTNASGNTDLILVTSNGIQIGNGPF